MSPKFLEVGDFKFDVNVPYQGINPFSISMTTTASAKAYSAIRTWPQPAGRPYDESRPETRSVGSGCFKIHGAGTIQITKIARDP